MPRIRGDLLLYYPDPRGGPDWEFIESTPDRSPLLRSPNDPRGYYGRTCYEKRVAVINQLRRGRGDTFLHELAHVSLDGYDIEPGLEEAMISTVIPPLYRALNTLQLLKLPPPAGRR